MILDKVRQSTSGGTCIFGIITALILLWLPAVAWGLDAPVAPADAGGEELLQLTAGGHVFGFRRKEMYVAAADHALKIEFVGARGVSP